ERGPVLLGADRVALVRPRIDEDARFARTRRALLAADRAGHLGGRPVGLLLLGLVGDRLPAGGELVLRARHLLRPDLFDGRVERLLFVPVVEDAGDLDRA